VWCLILVGHARHTATDGRTGVTGQALLMDDVYLGFSNKTHQSPAQQQQQQQCLVLSRLLRQSHIALPSSWSPIHSRYIAVYRQISTADGEEHRHYRTELRVLTVCRGRPVDLQNLSLENFIKIHAQLFQL